MFKVFLSHSSQDKAQVRILAKLLAQENDIEPWLDEWNLVPGEPWQEGIEQALEDCTVCLCLIGQESFGPWQHEEMRSAIARRVESQNQNFRVIPVLLPDGHRGDRSKLPSFLTRSTWVEFRETFEEENNYHRLICGIRGISPGAGPGGQALFSNEECPFPGLRFFDVGQAGLFFGREGEVQWLVRALDAASQGKVSNRFLAIVGGSGSGKSSLARAGLLASLNEGVLESSDLWPQVILYPGEQPLENLSFALSKADVLPGMSGAVQQFQKDLLTSERTLYTQGRLFSEKVGHPTGLILLVDQFEELFTLCKNEAHRKAFINNLCYAATYVQSNWIILLTIRSDFYGKCANYPPLSTLASEHQFLVEPMSDQALREAIQLPAQLSGLTLEPGLLENMLEDAAREPGSLPLLQDTLQELWNRRFGNTLSFKAYRELGGISGTLNQRATEFFQTLSPEYQKKSKQVFLRMVQPGEGTEDTKRRVTRKELMSVSPEPEVLENLIQQLSSSESRLLTSDKDYVEITHEALIREWDLLKGWIEEERENLRINRRLTQDVEGWLRAGQNSDFLYTGSRLAQMEDWAYQNTILLNENEKKFIEESITKRENKRKRERLIRLGAFGVLLLFIIVLTIALFSANKARQDAENRYSAFRLKEAGEDLKQVNPNLAIRLLELAREYEENEIIKTSLVELYSTGGFSKIFAGKGHTSTVYAVTFSPDGGQVLTGSRDKTARLWDLQGNELGRFEGHSGSINAVAFSPDGKQVLTGSRDYTARLWDLQGNELQRFEGHSFSVNAVAFSPDGGRVLTGSNDNTARLWEVRTYNDFLASEELLPLKELLLYVNPHQDGYQPLLEVWGILFQEPPGKGN